jgi:hypothetical protein
MARPFTAATQSSCDWDRGQWLVPVGPVASKNTKIGHTLVSVGGGLRDRVESPKIGPERVGVCAFVMMLFRR